MNIKIGKKNIGTNHPVFIVAELGINHNGKVSLAKKMMLEAKKAGADAAKLQSYITEDFVGSQTPIFTYRSKGKKVAESQFTMFKRNELSKSEIKELFKYANKIGIILFSTPQDNSYKMVNFLCGSAINMPAIKVGSDDLTNLPLLAYYAKKRRPVIISTGMATFEEIDDAVRIIKKQGNKKLIVLKCTSLYPTPPEEANLAQINTIRNNFNVMVGYSDHTIGSKAAVLATVLGARVIEKHFTLSKEMAGPDHWFSANPKEFKELVKKVRETELMIGKEDFILSPAEIMMKKIARRSIISIQAIVKGKKIRAEQLDTKRPGTGLPPKYLPKLIGHKAKKDYAVGHIFKLTDL